MGRRMDHTRSVRARRLDRRGENRIELFEEIQFPNSLGFLLGFTAFLASKSTKANTSDGMAHTAATLSRQVYKLVEVKDDGSFA